MTRHPLLVKMVAATVPTRWLLKLIPAGHPLHVTVPPSWLPPLWLAALR